MVSDLWLPEKLKKTLSVSTLGFLAGIAGYKLLGPYFLPSHVAGDFYHDFLPERLQDMALHTRINLQCRHEGNPPHFLLRFGNSSTMCLKHKGWEEVHQHHGLLVSVI